MCAFSGCVFVACPLCCGMLKLAVVRCNHCKVCVCVHDMCTAHEVVLTVYWCLHVMWYAHTFLGICCFPIKLV